MELKIVNSRDEFDSFVESHPYKHYMKTSMWGEFESLHNHRKYTLLGFYENNELTGTAMMLSGSWLGHKYLYVPKGPCIDYEDEKMTDEAFRLLRIYADQKKVRFLRVDPNVLRQEHLLDGTVIEDGINNEHITKQIVSLGYKHKGYGYAYDGSWANRYTLMVDLKDDMKTVRSRFMNETKRCIKRCEQWKINTINGTMDDLKSLSELEKQLSKQKSFPPHSMEFFEDLVKCFGDHAHIYVTKIDIPLMVASLTADLTGKKYRKDPEARESCQKMIDRLEGLRAEYGDVTDVSVGLFLHLGDCSWDLYAYNHKAFTFVHPTDAMHSHAMEDLQSLGVRWYDLCGFSGVTTKDDPEYGLYEYKRCFGSIYIEQIGEFDYVRNEPAMKRYRFEKIVINHFKRKLWTYRYK